MTPVFARVLLFLTILAHTFFLSAQTRDAKRLESVAHGVPRLRSPVDYVNPNIGGIAHLLTTLTPDVQQPHGMVTISPVVDATVTDVYLAPRILGFSIGRSILTPAVLGAADKAVTTLPAIDHDREIATPYYASYILDPDAVRAEYTTSERAMFFRFGFPQHSRSCLQIKASAEAEYEVASSTVIKVIEEEAGVRDYLYIEFSQPVQIVNSSSAMKPARFSGKGVSILLSPPSPTIQVRAGMSYISMERAKDNLAEEIADWNFNAAKRKARLHWNSALGKITVTGGTEDQRTIFYTALYRSLQYMRDVTEGDEYLGAFDHVVHPAEGHHFYIEDNLWDTYRTRHPLQLIIEPERYRDVLRSYVRMYEESGWMPHFPFMDGDRLYMLGNHASAIFADAYFKGERGFDVEKAYEGLKKNSLEGTLIPYRHGPATALDHFYAAHGFFPALDKGETESVATVHPSMRRQAVSVTLENSYDDWAISEMARSLGKKDDAEIFGKRALFYRNVFNSQIGFMAPRNKSGEFIGGYNPKWSGGQGGRDYFTECNGLVYSFHVQHDVAGLIELMGGREHFVSRLDDLFSEAYDGRYKFEFLSQFPDSTALIGQYPQGNEPAFHIPYLYNYAGAPWKTQKRVRDIMRLWYSAQPLGLPGDDDNGSTSSWYVFSAIGFYPVSPGRPVYDIGSPIFSTVEIHLQKGKTFRIIARNVSSANKYIQSATLNGHSLSKPWFTHDDLIHGGLLVLQMGSTPNKYWGAAPDAAPPSLSTQVPR